MDLILIVMIAFSYIAESRLEKFGYSSLSLTLWIWAPTIIAGIICIISQCLRRD